MHTGSAHGLAGGTLRTRCFARCMPRWWRDHRGIWELQWRTTWLQVHSATIRLRRCAACSETGWQRAPTVPVATVVDCPRLAIGLAMSIETRLELRRTKAGTADQRQSPPRRMFQTDILCFLARGCNERRGTAEAG